MMRTLTLRLTAAIGWKKALVFVALVVALALQPAAAIPGNSNLKSGPPDWYTPEFHAGVVAAGGDGLPLPAGALPSSSLLFAGIRPGSWMVYPSWCTMNFLFSPDGNLSSPLYIGTARHCVGHIGESVTLAVSRSPGASPRAIQIGKVTHLTKAVAQVIGDDFALVKIDSQLADMVSPSAAFVGGPLDAYRGSSFVPVLQTGHGLALGAGGNARSGSISAYNSSFPHGYAMVLPAVPGDSGSPVLTVSGDAVGSVTHIGVDLNGHFVPGNAFGTRVSRVFENWGLRLVTCRGGTPWPYAGCP